MFIARAPAPPKAPRANAPAPPRAYGQARTAHNAAVEASAVAGSGRRHQIWRRRVRRIAQHKLVAMAKVEAGAGLAMARWAACL